VSTILIGVDASEESEDAGGVSGRVVRDAHCPVIVAPRGIEAPLDALFSDTTATAA
jgi:hypothetical protein